MYYPTFKVIDSSVVGVKVGLLFMVFLWSNTIAEKDKLHTHTPTPTQKTFNDGAATDPELKCLLTAHFQNHVEINKKDKNCIDEHLLLCKYYSLYLLWTLDVQCKPHTVNCSYE